jgi:sugar phosphate isomerase/epimerase
MIRSPLALRINGRPERDLRAQIRQAASLGARGVVLDAIGDLTPDRLGDTGRRDLRHLLRSSELALAAVALPTRRPFDTDDQLDDRLARADRAFALAFDLGSRLVLVHAGRIPAEADEPRRVAYHKAISELTLRAEHRGVVLALEAGSDSGAALASQIEAIRLPGLAASLDPATQLRQGVDPVESARALGRHLAHAYASDSPAGVGFAAARLVVEPSRGFGSPGGTLDWEAYLGTLEEVDYRGFVTIWPDLAADQAAVFRAIRERLDRF